MQKIDKKQKILLTAQKCFVKTGYKGTSLRDIANQAMIPLSLIYYYYSSKQDLWIEVKLNMAKGYFNEDILSYAPDDNLKEFLEYIIKKRFDFYSNNSDITKLIQWQALEDSDKDLSALDLSLNKLKVWKEAIQKLQDTGKIRQDWNINHVLIFITTTASAPFFIYSNFLNNINETEERNLYLKMIIDILHEGLKPPLFEIT